MGISLLILLTAALTKYGIATRGGDFGIRTRERALAESAVIWLSGVLCLAVVAENLLPLGPWLTGDSAPWLAIPTLLWTCGMLVVDDHPADRTALGAGLSTVLPQVYQAVLETPQLLAGFISGSLLVFTLVWCWRRRDGSDG
ncbi:MAG: hypothetical protein ACO3ND_09870 [Opitutales bacterium]